MSPVTRRAMWEHLLPFAAWIALMVAPFPDPAVGYLVRTVAGAGLLVAARPWRHYARFAPRHVLPALGVGVGVLFLWVTPESALLDGAPALRDLYLRYAVTPLGRPPAPVTASPFDPVRCGAALALVRLLGSALVIAVAEEYFWRGFLYRWLVRQEFLDADLSRVHWPVFLAVAAVFGFEHDRWLAGLAAGVLYGLLYVRTRDLHAAVLAHVTTNLLLGVYVLATGSYGFW